MKFGYTKTKTKCSRCKQKFEIGTLKVITPNILGSSSGYKTGSYHFSCYIQENVKPPQIEDIEMVMESFKIDPKDKEKLENFIIKCQQEYSILYSKKRKFDTLSVVKQDKGIKKTKEEFVIGIPFEIWNLILSFISDDFLIVYRLQFVNKDFYQLTQQDSIWELACKNHSINNWILSENLERVKNTLNVFIRNERKEVEPNWKMIFIELYSKTCFVCHQLLDGQICDSLGGKLLCYYCKSIDSYHLLSKTNVKEVFKLKPKEIESIPSEKYPTTRQGVKYKESYFALNCQKYLENKRLETLKENTEMSEIYKLSQQNPKRLYVECLIPDYNDDMKNIEKLKANYGCKKCGKILFQSSELREPKYDGCLSFESKSFGFVNCCKIFYSIRKKNESNNSHHHIGKWYLNFIPTNEELIKSKSGANPEFFSVWDGKFSDW